MFQARVLLVEDHIVVRQGIKALLSDEPDIEIVGEADNGREALPLVETLQPNLVLMDISMPGLNGIEATRQILQRYPQVKVIILSMHASEEYVFQVLRAGALGYVLKQSDSSEVLMAIRAVLAGGSFLSPPISRAVIDNYVSRAETRGRDSSQDLLTSREREVLQLLAEGLANREIAQQLNISVKTVETHRSNMMSKLNLTGKTELVKYALRKGWAALEE
ncbi:MAG: response regulator transcription factor [Anaerolineae bacterium]|nr:response regulator transcription factor [Anaerolineae bacterium]